MIDIFTSDKLKVLYPKVRSFVERELYPIKPGKQYMINLLSANPTVHLKSGLKMAIIVKDLSSEQQFCLNKA